MYEGTCFPTFLPTECVIKYFDNPMGKKYSLMVVVCLSLRNEVECLLYTQANLILLQFTLLHLTDIAPPFFFNNNLKLCGNSVLSKLFGAIYPIAFAPFLSLCHILVILTIFQTFSLFYLLWLICDQ